MTSTLAAVVMAAGLGTRMRSRRPKHLHPLLGRRLVDWAVAAVRPLGVAPFVVVCSPNTRDELASSLPDGVGVAVQDEPRGTGDAVAAARSALAGHDGDVLVVPGDSPLLTSEMLAALVDAHRRARPAVTLMTIETEKQLAYGRIVRDASGGVVRIVEERDATPAERAIRELNASVYVFSSPDLWRALERLDDDNEQGELYLTDTVARLVEAGRPVVAAKMADLAVVEAAQGVNTRSELAEAAAVLRDRILVKHMLAGVTVVDPTTTWIEADVVLEPDAVIHPFTVLRGTTLVRADAEVGPHVVADGAEIGAGALVGPFAYLRPGAVLASGAKVGTYVEVKNSRIGERTKVPHLSYIGDAEIGEDTNIGAGTITANFPHEPGRPKGRTQIGRNVRTGIHNGFEAPITIGDGAWIGGGSYITDDVPPESLAIARPRQVTKEGYVRRSPD
jgi:bifunctional UDP-N-acetylglucosamine pyrophosphorylase / glucosamine-1-phosphate N-acetyltransferase